MPVIIVLAGMFFVGLFLTLFNQFYSEARKKEFYDLLLKLEENPDDEDLKAKAIEAGRTYNRKQTIFTSRFSSISYGQTSFSENMIDTIIENTLSKGKYKQINEIGQKQEKTH
ncbi:hypothetical protein REC12_13780 [Desulfosporosinus sp. PR]|uniref:hypothetical protein n=1 Tax=Candidatus Desulfosporosinus nitrosoreducens TaxID=3401928 RepID=UPI0027F13DFF|nr:hypothetical protein [Desulfosporosinus sp. PR]MDQ7094661.1 hypothetical protein [Desulfosporosinus sp. PR]